MEKKQTYTKYDAADYLQNEEEMRMFLDICFQESNGNPAFIAKALGTIARARGMSKLAKKTGISREGLYKALSGNGNPEFSTIMKVIDALGFKLQTVAQ